MKLFYITIALFLCNNISYSQNIDWINAKQSEKYWGASVSAKTDNSNNLYITGFFHNYGFSFEGDTLINSGDDDIYLVKYDENGSISWVKSYGNSGRERPTDMAIDINGNIYLVGHFNSNTIQFDSYTLTTNGGDDIFLIKIDPTGNVLWAKNYGTAGYEAAYSVSTDDVGNVYFIGHYNDNPITIDTISLSNQGGYDVVFAKLNPSGDVIWAKNISSSTTEVGRSIIIDSLNNIYITGYYTASSISVDGITLTNNGTSNEMYIAKFNSDGDVLWAKSAGGTDMESGYKVTIGESGNVYVNGMIRSNEVDFGGVVLYNTSGTEKDFIVKYNSTGQALWGKIIEASIKDVVVNSLGDVTITGSFNKESIDVDTELLVNNSEWSEDMGVIIYKTDLFLANYNLDGELQLAESIGSLKDESANSICIDNSGSYYLLGDYASDTINFGQLPLYYPDAISIYIRTFIVKFDMSNNVGIEFYLSEPQVNIYPNPTKDFVNVQVNNNDLSIISVIDISGRLLIKESFNNNIKIETKDFEKGVYNLKIETYNKVITKRVVVY